MPPLLAQCNKLAPTIQAAARSASSLAEQPSPHLKGRYEWWKEPIYVQPVSSPLARGPDFSFLDGRRPRLTSYHEWLKRKDQVALAEQAVKYLAELKEAKGMRDCELKRRAECARRADTLRLNVKGNIKFA